MNSYDSIANMVRAFWKTTYPQTVIAFFFQKYDFDSEWEYCEELIYPHSSDNCDSVVFHNDFCEGQTEVKDIRIVSLDEVIQFYRDNSYKQSANNKAVNAIENAITKFRQFADYYISVGDDYHRCRGLAYETAADFLEISLHDLGKELTEDAGTD